MFQAYYQSKLFKHCNNNEVIKEKNEISERLEEEIDALMHNITIMSKISPPDNWERTPFSINSAKRIIPAYGKKINLNLYLMPKHSKIQF